MKKTTITLNRFITFIQSWQGKLPLGLLLFFLIIVFFSCKDDSAFIGLKKDPRLKADYVDIPLYPSVVNYNTILTQNFSDDLGSSGDPFGRTMIGKITDPRFGSVTATTYLNFGPPLTIFTPDPAATADSIVMELALDFYQIGSSGTTLQTFEVHELLDTLNAIGYYSSSTVPYSSAVVAKNSFAIDPDYFASSLTAKADADTSNDQSVKLRLTLPVTLAQNILQEFIDNTAAASDFSVFSGKYKGYALVPKACDKIFGIDPVIAAPYNRRQSRVILYYTSGGVQSAVTLPMYPAINSITGISNNVVSFTSFSTDRSGSALNGIQPFKDFNPTDGYCYVQGGTALVTKFDLRDFYKYVDTLKNVIINSAQLVTNNTVTEGYLSSVRLRVLDSLNTFRNPYEDSLINDVIQNNIPKPIFRKKASTVFSFGSADTSPTVDLLMLGSAASPISLDSYQLDGAILTDFCQRIVTDGHNPQRIKWIAMVPNDNEFRKSLNLLVLDPTTKLRVYYSQPIIKVR